MKFNISDPTTGGQKKIEIEDDKYIRPIFDRRMGTEINGELIGDDFKGYVFKITGGNDKQGFAMKQGILISGRTQILFRKSGSTFRARRSGERKRRSVRGCYTGPDLAAVFLKIMKKGEKDIAGCTDVDIPNRLGKKRRQNIISTFALDAKKDDVRKYVVRREIKRGDKTFYKSPKIQRLITETRLRRKRQEKKVKQDRFKASKEALEKYEKLLSQHIKEKKAAKKVDNEATHKVKA